MIYSLLSENVLLLQNGPTKWSLLLTFKKYPSSLTQCTSIFQPTPPSFNHRRCKKYMKFKAIWIYVYTMQFDIHVQLSSAWKNMHIGIFTLYKTKGLFKNVGKYIHVHNCTFKFLQIQPNWRPQLCNACTRAGIRPITIKLCQRTPSCKSLSLKLFMTSDITFGWTIKTFKTNVYCTILLLHVCD